MTKICCISDLHGRLPKQLPEHDLLCIAGDICPLENHNPAYQKLWILKEFYEWWKEIKSPRAIGCWGNHDIFTEDLNYYKLVFDAQTKPLMISDYQCVNNVAKLGINAFLSSYQTPFGQGWAYNKYDDDMRRICEQVPDNINVIVSHGPAYSYGDAARRWKQPGFELTGYKCMVELMDRIKPKLFICGHIHSGYGVYQHGETIVVNASLCNEKYQLVNEPIIVEI